MEIQTTFLDQIEIPKEEPEGQQINPELSEWALVYLVTYAGGNQGNLFVLRKEDAQKFCGDKCSHGTARGGKWLMQWTSLDKFANKGNAEATAQMENVHGELEPFIFIRDTGKQDKDFERLGIQKPSIDECPRLLESMGYQFKYKSGKDLFTDKEWREAEKEEALSPRGPWSRSTKARYGKLK